MTDQWEVAAKLTPFSSDFFDGKIRVTLPSDIWITPEEARKFAAELLTAADQQDAHNAHEGANANASKV